jgi:UDP-glucose 4-epimerase
MKILITGGAGFIGSHLAGKYLERGDEVHLLDNLSTGRWENVAGLQQRFPDRMFFRKESILNEDVLAEMTEAVDMVIHLAAAVGVKYIIDNPLSALETNIIGTENVLKWAKKYKRKILIASSSEVYGDQEKAPLSEEDSVIYGPSVKLRWSYAASKLVDEFLALAYHRTFALPVVICRFFNIIGPKQTGEYGMVVPRFVERALRGEPLSVHGDGTQTRTFTYIEDAVRAIMDVMACDRCAGEIINVGGREEITILDLANRIILLAGSSSKVERIPYEQVYGRDFDDMKRRVPALEKIGRLVGYVPEYDLESSLRAIIADFRLRNPKP